SSARAHVGGQEYPEPADVTHVADVLTAVDLDERSSTAVLGLTLGEEGLGALEHVVGREDAIRGVELSCKAGGQVGVGRQVDESLRLADGDGAASGDLRGDLHRRGTSLGYGHSVSAQ